MTADRPTPTPFTYREVGATGHDRLPAGYRHLRYRLRLDPATLPAAAEVLLSWRAHNGFLVRVVTSAPRVRPGVRATTLLGAGPLRVSAPTVVVWTVAEEDRAGFAYGTLPGHPARGEESFVVSRDAAGEVWFTVTSFSLPVRWYMRAAGPVGPLLQRLFARGYARRVRRLALRERP